MFSKEYYKPTRNFGTAIFREKFSSLNKKMDFIFNLFQAFCSRSDHQEIIVVQYCWENLNIVQHTK